MVPGVLRLGRDKMYTPTDQPIDRLVIARTTDGYMPGIFTGETRQDGEAFEIEFENFLCEFYQMDKRQWFHKEDLYESNEENSNRFFGE